MISIFVYHHAAAEARQLLERFQVYFAQRQKPAGLYYYADGWAVALGQPGELRRASIESLAFDLVLRHGSDPWPVALGNFQPAARKVIFGGGSWHYTPQLPGEIAFLHAVDPKKGLSFAEIDALVRFARQETPSVPYFLFDPALEGSLAAAYRGFDPARCPLRLGFWKDGRVIEQAGQRRVLVVWNNDSRPPQLEPTELYQVTHATYDKFFNEYWSYSPEIAGLRDYDAIVLCAELSAPGGHTPRQGLAGLELAYILRQRENLLCPLILCSMFAHEALLQRDRPGLLRTPGHYYFDLRATAPPPLDVRALSETLAHDIRYYHLDTAGRLDELVHELKSSLRRGGTPGLAIPAFFAELRVFYAESFQQEATALAQLQDEFIRRFDKDGHNSRQIAALTEQLKLKIAAILDVMPPESGEKLPEPGGWSALLVEDNPVDAQFTTELLAMAGVQCRAVSTAAAAFEELERDRSEQRYALVITDWRLLDPNGDWQPWQGLEIIEAVVNDPARFSTKLSFAVITDKTGAIQRSVRRRQPIDIAWFDKKEVFVGGGAPAFAARLIERGNEMQQLARNRQPLRWYTPWTKYQYPLNNYYDYYRRLADYLPKRRQVDFCALNYIVWAVLVDAGHAVEVPVSSRFNSYEFPVEFKLQLKIPPSGPGGLTNFYGKLVARRVYFGLSRLGWRRRELGAILFKNKLRWLKPAEEGRIEQDRENHETYLVNYLALPAEGSRPLPEEVEFLNSLDATIEQARGALTYRLYELIQQLQEDPDFRIAPKLLEGHEALFHELGPADTAVRAAAALRGFYDLCRAHGVLQEPLMRLVDFAVMAVHDPWQLFGLARGIDEKLVAVLLEIAGDFEQAES
jgi:CheY-like chemotaxis protein